MRGLRVLKVLLPAALVVFLLLLFVALNLPERGGEGSDEASAVTEDPRKATGVNVKQIEGADVGVEMDADVIRMLDGTRVQLEGVKRLTIPRSDGSPLIVQSARALVEGEAGDYRIRFEEGVRVEDPDRGMVVTLPTLEWDEVAGEAHSQGEIVIESPHGKGQASRLVYGMSGQPAELFEPRFETVDGAILTAEKAYLLDGLNDVQLANQVLFQRGEERLQANGLRLKRSEEGWIQSAEALDTVRAKLATGAVGLTSVEAERLEIQWHSAEEIGRMELQGSALISQADRRISAETILAYRGESLLANWQVDARGTVHVAGLFSGEPAWVRCESLLAQFVPPLVLRSAEASGRVVFEGPSTRAEADEATFDVGTDLRGRVRLFSRGDRKARLSRERTRVAALEIVTDPRGTRLEARGAVEATLLPGSSALATGNGPGLFRQEEAVHFVAEKLESTESGGSLTFTGGVRAWQGERNLAAERVELLQGEGRLEARGKVSTRIPRSADAGALTEDDFVQISADRLDYDEKTRHGEYVDNVRVGLAEGWMESGRLAIDLGSDGGALSQVTAYRKVRVEFEESPDGEAPRLVVGTADRLTYDPATGDVRLLGDESPATVRRLAAGGATTSGRVLHYNLELGTLEVDSGEQLPSKIRGN